MTSNTDPDVLLQKAIQLHQNGQLDTAESIYLSLLESFPNHVTLLTNLGTIAFNRGQLEQSLKYLDQSLEISFYQPVALNSRGNALDAFGRLTEALSSYDCAISLDPIYVEAYFNKGNVLRKLDQLEKALLSYDKALELNPNHVASQLNRRVVVEALEDNSGFNGHPIDLKNTYQYSGFYIVLPSNHMLPHYQQSHPKYDRFLPHLAQYLNANDTVIDIGANVGDTLAGMVEKNPLLNYICIEPDDHFFAYLKKNIQLIKNTHSQLNVSTVQSLVGKDITGVKLEGDHGSKHAVLDESVGIKSKQLDELLANIASENIRLIKSDVDGFDYDVLGSSLTTIEINRPILYFECQYDFEYQKNGYEKILIELEKLGYCDWLVFDNFGQIMLRTNELKSIFELLNYVWSQNTGRATRTIYYFDILATQKKEDELISKVVREYN